MDLPTPHSTMFDCLMLQAGMPEQHGAGRAGRDFIAYVSSRAAVILFYVGAGAMLSLTGSHYSALHVHHLYLGFAIAMWAEFDHPVSPLHPHGLDVEVVTQVGSSAACCGLQIAVLPCRFRS